MTDPSSLHSRRVHSRRGFLPRLDGEPHRAWACVNVRQNEKRVFEVLRAWWEHEERTELAQWDGFSILLQHYLRTADLPPELIALVRAPLDA